MTPQEAAEAITGIKDTGGECTPNSKLGKSRQIAEAIERAIAAERDRCAQVADRLAAQMQEQIDRNNEYMARTGSIDHEPNNLCRRTKHAAETIAQRIRADG